MATIVRKKPGQSEDSLIAQFRKKILNEEVLEEMKAREFYLKPSRKRYEQERALKKRRPRRSY
ncbi:MAG: 30S ribosomal protein S21 [Patescibacteria group bacterium]